MNAKINHPVFAGIVTYNPDIDRLRQNIEAINRQVDKVVIVDNNSKNIELIINLVDKYCNASIIRNDSNLGIAKALNQIMEVASKNNAEWVLTLDQDSVVSNGLVEEYWKYVNVENVGMLTCIIKDRNTDGYKVGVSGEKYSEVERCFTSGCFTKVEAWRKVGGFDEKMFIDYVDYDLCLSIREAGYIIIRVNIEGLLHELGNSKDVRFLGRNWVVSNHSSFRKYYIVRNRLYYIKKHANSLNTLLEMRHLLGFITLTMFREPNKLNNLKAILKGLRDYKKMLG